MKGKTNEVLGERRIGRRRFLLSTNAKAPAITQCDNCSAIIRLGLISGRTNTLSSKILTGVLSRVSSQVRKTLLIALLLEKCEASSLLEPSLPGLVSLVPLLIASDLIWRCAATTRKCGRLSCLTSKTLLVAKNGKKLDSKPL
jgi:hypothetical protein